jgi:hypothetical protein
MTHGLQPIFLHVKPADIALIKFVFESYEGVAVVRTLDRHDAIIVVLVSEDFLEVARQIIVSLHEQVSFDEVPVPIGAGEVWLLNLLWGET